MIDAAGRTIDYMRISITDRCNLRCRYCMPDGITQVAMSEILTYEEIKATYGSGGDIAYPLFADSGNKGGRSQEACKIY